jgi:hypothetical protein
MLWDCPFCGTQKLLGLSQRHCPACGGAQDPQARYYPSDADKVAVQDHIFFGADIVCPACATPNGARSSFCAGCGSPLQGGKAAQARSDQIAGPGQGFSGESIKDAKAEVRARRMATVDARMAKAQPQGMSRGLKIGLIVGGIVLVVTAIVLTLVFWKKEVALEVDSHAWTRTVEIETFKSVSESAWCDQMPKKAYSVTRSKEQRSTKKIPDGETCKTRRKDNRDGTFKEVKECTPKYREEPVYDQKCRFKIDKWVHARDAKAEGSSRDPAPAWPAVKLSKTGTCKGCEREGKRTETYVLHYVDETNEETHECEVSQQRWQETEPGSRWKAKVGMVSTSLDCDSLVAAD